LFGEEVGNRPNEEETKRLLAICEDRFKLEVPPGYRDHTKPENKHGDMFIWFELIAMAKEKRKPVIFVVNDDKPDWTLEVSGKKLGPRPELIQEFYDQTGGLHYYHYNISRFLEEAEKHLVIEKPTKELIKEVEEVRKESQKQREYRNARVHVTNPDIEMPLPLRATPSISVHRRRHPTPTYKPSQIESLAELFLKYEINSWTELPMELRQQIRDAQLIALMREEEKSQSPTSHEAINRQIAEETGREEEYYRERIENYFRRQARIMVGRVPSEDEINLAKHMFYDCVTHDEFAQRIRSFFQSPS
jgi:hypothetical protein